MTAPLAVIFGCEGPALTPWEADFFRSADPLGFILFARNCQVPDQIRTLIRDLRETIGRPEAPVLIDQEGGRVARLKPPAWRAAPPAADFGALAAVDPDRAAEAVRLNARLLAAELGDLGINVDCAPVLDLRRPETHAAIGDRAFGPDPALVAALGRAFCEGLLDGGVCPVVKHMPGHGRAVVDSHAELPVISAALDDLEATDFEAFRLLNDAPMGMTAHIVCAALDPDRPATTSPVVIEQVIRGRIGFQGFLMSDDLSMSALQGTLGARAAASLAAGCDAVLHCNGERAEMEAVAGAAGPLNDAARARLDAAMARCATPPETIEIAAMSRTLDAIMSHA